jgi:hypothetical protein
MRISEMQDPVIVWDCFRSAYWKEDGKGYTGAAEMAGIWERSNAPKGCKGRKIEHLKVPSEHVQYLKESLDDARAANARLAARVAELEKDAERYRWRTVEEAHEDFGECVYIDINDPGNACIAHVCDLGYSDTVEPFTHFAQLPKLTEQIAEELMAAQRQKEGS